MTTQVEAYQESLRTIIETKHQLESLRKVVADGAAALDRWRQMYVKNSDVEFPTALTTEPQAPFIDAKRWPSAQTIAEALITYRDAVADAKEVWDQLSEHERIGFRPPADY